MLIGIKGIDKKSGYLTAAVAMGFVFVLLCAAQKINKVSD
jgi:hypothetical protein